MFVQKITFHVDIFAKIELKDYDNECVLLSDGTKLKPTSVIYRECHYNELSIKIIINDTSYIGYLTIDMNEGEVEYRIIHNDENNDVDIYKNTENGYVHEITCFK